MAPSPMPAQQPLSPPFSSVSPSIIDERQHSPSRASKRKRESSAQLVQQRQYSNSTPMPSSTSYHISAPPKKTKRAKPAPERPQPDSAAESTRAPTPMQKRTREQQPTPRPSTAAPAPDDALLLTSYLRPKLMQDGTGWAELCAQKHRRVSNEQMVRLYWFVQRAMEAHVDTTYMGVRIDMEHVAAALEVAPEWYEQGRQTLALLLLYGRGGTQYEDARVLEAMAHAAPAAVPGSDPTPLLELLRAVHEEWMANSVEEEPEIQEVAG